MGDIRCKFELISHLYLRIRIRINDPHQSAVSAFYSRTSYEYIPTKYEGNRKGSKGNTGGIRREYKELYNIYNNFIIIITYLCLTM